MGIYLISNLKCAFKGGKMDKKIFILIVCFVCLLFQGCKTVIPAYRLTPAVLTNQDQKKIDPGEGYDAVLSNKDTNITAAIIRTSTDTFPASEHPAIVVGINSMKPVDDFSTENIKAFVDGNPLHVLTADEVIAEIKEEYEANVKTIRQTYESSIQDSVVNSKRDPNDPDVFSPSVLDSEKMPGSSYKAQYKYDFKAIGRDEKDAAIKAEADGKMLKEQLGKDIKDFQKKALVKTKVPAGEWFFREVRLEKIPNPGKPHKIKVIITALNEKHEFIINTSK